MNGRIRVMLKDKLTCILEYIFSQYREASAKELVSEATTF